MTITREDAIHLLSRAGVTLTALDEAALPIGRVAICRRLMEHCTEEAPRELRLEWGTPVLGLACRGNEWALAEFVAGVVQSGFGLQPLAGEERGLETFGDVALHVEERMRSLWRLEAVGGCASQSAFYVLRRAVHARWSAPVRAPRLRPGSRLRDCLPAAETEEVRELFRRRFGVAELPVGRRVFGIAALEIGATWLALWFPVFLLFLILCADPTYPRSGVLIWSGLLAPPVALAALLNLLARPTWLGVRTLGDLTRWTLRQNAKVVREMQRAWE